MKLGGLDFVSWTRQQYKLSKERWKILPHRKVLWVIVSSLIAVLVSVVVCYLVIPQVTDLVIIRLRVLKNGTSALKRWERQQMPLITRVYLWNLTNADQVASGLSKPVLQEVGPYIFEKITVKTPIKFKEDSIVYTETSTYHYREDLTVPRSLNDTFVTLQAALYGAAALTHDMAPAMMSTLEAAVPSLFPGVDSIFMAVRVGDYLLDGLPINCSTPSSVSAMMVCGMLPSTAPPTIRRLPNSKDFAYSFLHHKNATMDGPLEQMRGIHNIHEIAQIVTYHNKSTLGVWKPGSNCDRLRGTDTLNFSPFLSKDDTIEIFISDICQVLPLHYEQEESIHFLTVYKFTPKDWFKNNDSNPDNKCYCLGKETPYCSKDGVRDISACMKAPVVISHPHFLEADPEFREYAQGSAPDRGKHLSELYIEPQSGTPCKGSKRLQFNMPLMRLEGFSLVENVTEGLFPLLWIEESVTVDRTSLWPVRLPLITQWVVNFISVCVGSLMAKIFVCSLLSYLYLTKACCFRNMKSNRITAHFYRPRNSTSDVVETSISVDNADTSNSTVRN